MGRAVVHFEVLGKDAGRLQSYYGDLFDWKIQNFPEMSYGTVSREENLNADGAGIGGGVGQGPEGYDGHVTFYVEVPDVEEALSRAESLGGTRVMGPMEPMEGLVLGQFTDPEGHLIGLVKENPATA